MNKSTNKYHDENVKASVALAMLKCTQDVDTICREFNVLKSQAYAWKAQLEEHCRDFFADKRKMQKEPTYEKLQAELETVKEERDFLVRVLNR